MTDRFTEPGQEAVDGAIDSIDGISEPVLEPGIRLAVDDGKVSLNVPTLPVQQAPASTVTKAQFDAWLRDAIRAWESASNDAIDRATDVLESAAEVNMYASLGNVLDVSGALLAPIAPWAAAASAALAIILKDVLPPAPTTVSLETFATQAKVAVDRVARQFLTDLPKLVDELVKSNQFFNWTTNQAQENALLRVLDFQAVRKVNSGVVDVNETRLRALLELRLLLDFAGTGQRYEGFAGGTIPFVIAVAEYAVKPTFSGSAADRKINSPNHWEYKLVNFYIQTKSLPKFTPRIKSLLKMLKQPLSLWRYRVPLSIEFDISDTGKYEYIVRTSLWQPPRPFRIEFTTHVSEGVDIETGGKNDTLRVANFSSLGDEKKKAFESHATTSRYQGFTLLLSFEQVVGLILTREAWGGPFPDINL